MAVLPASERCASIEDAYLSRLAALGAEDRHLACLASGGVTTAEISDPARCLFRAAYVAGYLAPRNAAAY
jgi:hypothetical protein